MCWDYANITLNGECEICHDFEHLILMLWVEEIVACDLYDRQIGFIDKFFVEFFYKEDA